MPRTIARARAQREPRRFRSGTPVPAAARCSRDPSENRPPPTDRARADDAADGRGEPCPESGAVMTRTTNTMSLRALARAATLGGLVALACDKEADPNFCGDGVVGDEEECDDANLDDNDACPSTCHIAACGDGRSEEHTSELQSPCNLVCRLLLEK